MVCWSERRHVHRRLEQIHGPLAALRALCTYARDDSDAQSARTVSHATTPHKPTHCTCAFAQQNRSAMSAGGMGVLTAAQGGRLHASHCRRRRHRASAARRRAAISPSSTLAPLDSDARSCSAASVSLAPPRRCSSACVLLEYVVRSNCADATCAAAVAPADDSDSSLPRRPPAAAMSLGTREARPAATTDPLPKGGPGLEHSAAHLSLGHTSGRKRAFDASRTCFQFVERYRCGVQAARRPRANHATKRLTSKIEIALASQVTTCGPPLRQPHRAIACTVIGL
jgi:hypothetical protein